MKVSLSEHLRLESDARSFLNKSKHCKKISDFKIDKISMGEIKVTLNLNSNREVIVQLRSSYSKEVIENAIKARIPSAVSDSSHDKGVELAVAQA